MPHSKIEQEKNTAIAKAKLDIDVVRKKLYEEKFKSKQRLSLIMPDFEEHGL